MRQAAWAGWYSAFGDAEQTKSFVHQAHSEWIKELGAGRRYSFLNQYNHDIWKHIPEEKLKMIVSKFFNEIKSEIKKHKKTNI